MTLFILRLINVNIASLLAIVKSFWPIGATRERSILVIVSSNTYWRLS
jgi:hypothetical protein